jgi:hypothetical protein
MDSLLASLRSKGSQHLMLEAAAVLSPQQRATAYAVAMEIMRSDGLLEPDEWNSLANLLRFWPSMLSSLLMWAG